METAPGNLHGGNLAPWVCSLLGEAVGRTVVSRIEVINFVLRERAPLTPPFFPYIPFFSMLPYPPPSFPTFPFLHLLPSVVHHSEDQENGGVEGGSVLG